MTERIGKRSLDISRRSKKLYPDYGITKGEIIDYYTRIYPYMEPHLRDRPISFERYPDGLGGTHFFQKNAPEYFPDWIQTITLEKQDGEVDYVIADERAALAFLADQGTVVIHIFLSRADHPHCPDRFVVDLDPPKGEFARARKAAQQLRAVIEDVGLHPFVMTTGSSGLHVTTPILSEASYDDVRDVVRRIVQVAVQQNPEGLTLEQRKEKREGRVYLDALRNAYGQTGVCPYSVRAKPGAPVATPLDWRELGNPKLRSDRYHVRNLFRRLGQKADPWSGFSEAAASLRDAEKRL